MVFTERHPLMTSSILHELTSDKSYQNLPLPVLEEIYPREVVCEVLHQTTRWEKRERKLNHLFLIYLLIAWTISPFTALKHVCQPLLACLRWCSPQHPTSLPSSSALSYRRRTLGISPLRLLMRQACQPLCQPETPGGFLFGHRLIAIDSKLFDVPDTPENDWTFRGRSHDEQPRSHSPFPQVRLLSALEVGSHAHVGAVVAPGYRSERSLVEDLLSFLPPDSLVLQDAGFRGAWWIQRLLQQGHHSITRLQANDFPCTGPRLSDGSYLVEIQHSSGKRLPEPLTLRIIEYQLAPEVAEPLSQLQKSRVKSGSDASRPPDQVYRLATTLLEPGSTPVREIAACYHQRWEVEIVYDELQEHQLRLPHLQSRTSDGVMQEVWALLLGHYALRAWMMRSACQQEGLDVDHLSFTQALCIMGTALTLSQSLDQTPKDRWLPRFLQDLRHPDSLLPPRRVRSYPRVVKAASTRFYVKKEKDLPFVLTDHTKTWDDFILPLFASHRDDVILLI